jgi:tetratricopeptide (TPR) repeat protein
MVLNVRPEERATFFQAYPRLLGREALRRFSDEVPNLARSDLARAQQLLEIVQWMADRLGDDFARGRSERAAGHIAQISGRYPECLEHYDRAIARFRAIGDDLEVAITQIGSLQPMAYVGRYSEAYARAEQARDILIARGDRLRMARLETNLGNIVFRQDLIEDALAHYQRAYEFFCAEGAPQDLAVTLRNLAVCYTSLNRFNEALHHYCLARDCCREHRLDLLALQNDYNIAYLYYLRGEYTRAIELYNATRAESRKAGDAYHHALCDLDQAELYLELNLADEGEELARDAFAAFERLGLQYEAAKALAFLAVAASQQGDSAKALQLFEQAQQRFVGEHNAVWPALIDLYSALVLFDQARYLDALDGAQAALDAFEGAACATKAALAELLIARVHLKTGDLAAAEAACRHALFRTSEIDSPGLMFQSHVVLGQLFEQLADHGRALSAYEQAHEALETLRSHLGGDELKIAFLKNKLVVFESLVHLLMTDAHLSDAAKRHAFSYIEQAKSRSLADLISFRAHALLAPSDPHNDLVDRVRQVREELNWYYHKIDLNQLKPDAGPAEQLETLRRQTRFREKQLVRLLNDLRGSDEEFRSLQHGTAVDLEALRASIPDGALLVEFYEARGVLYAALVGPREFDIVPLTSAFRIRTPLRLLNLQLSKFRLGPEYVSRFQRGLYDAAVQHLRELFTELVAPIRRRFDAEHLIIVPHDFLHHLPFHACFDGERFLADDFTMSYAPSASVFHLCRQKPRRYDESSLVLGVPDERVPHIADEVRAVGRALPNARVYISDDVTEARLREEGQRSRFVHIAAHGYFRQDNPMFSSIRLGHSQLTLFDLYRLELSAELVALSGCGTGRNVVVAGDEMLGLARGLLYAGAHSLLLTLWEVNDRSTAEYMTRFYDELLREPANTAAAVRRTMLAIRERYPHPYFWAPFILAGDFQRGTGEVTAAAA